MLQVEDKIKTNIRISKNMKADFKDLAGEMDLQDKLEELIIEYNKAWELLGIEKMLVASVRHKTKRKIAYNDENKEDTAKDQIITLKTDRYIYDTFKEHCDDLGVVFGEGVRRVLKQAILDFKLGQS